MKVAIIVFPGSNCDRDVAMAVSTVIGVRPTMVWHRDTDLPVADLIVLPGGFSYGDYLRSGAMAAHSPIMSEIVSKANKGVPILGICNGFQMLTEIQLLPGVLMRNTGLKFLCQSVHLRVESSNSLFTSGYSAGQLIQIPIAHHDGNYFADNTTLSRLEDNGQVAFRYVTENGTLNTDGNPNGSINDIAGVFNKNRTILGMMPHPDRAVDPVHGGIDGQTMFKSILSSTQ